MKEVSVRKITDVLGLNNHIVGIRFLTFKDEYDEVESGELKGKATVCRMLRLASEGQAFKVTQQHFGCNYGMFALGVGEADQRILAGESYARCGLYESYTVAQDVAKNLKYHMQKVYGVEMGPLENMKEADTAVVICDTEQGMRIFQGYAYKHGSPKNLCTVGNQAACSDIISKVIANNDINLTLWCKGARAAGRYTNSEMGIGLPIQLVDDLAQGLVMTINPVCNNEKKRELIKKYEGTDVLETVIIENMNYGMELTKFDRKLNEIQSVGDK